MFQSKMYQKVNLRIFVVLSFLSCSFIPSKTKVIPISGGMEITLPFYVKSGFRFIQLSLSPDQKPLRFLVDTGSRFSFLDERYFTELDSKKRISVSYPGGKDDSYRKTKTIQLFHNVFPIFKDITVYSHNFSGHLELDGIIGIDSLYDKIIILEYPTQIRFLEILDGKLSSISNLYGLERDAEPLRFVSGLPVLEVNYGTQDKSFLILDTGAEPSVLELPNPLPGIVEETFSSRSVSVLNFQGKVVNIRTKFVRKLCLIPTSICVEDLEILPSGLPVELSKSSSGIRIQGVLGVNWLNKHRILLDMKRSLIGIVGKDR